MAWHSLAWLSRAMHSEGSQGPWVCAGLCVAGRNKQEKGLIRKRELEGYLWGTQGRGQCGCCWSWWRSLVKEVLFFLWMAILCHPCLSIPEKKTTRKGSLGRSPFLMQYERQTRGKATDRRTLDSRYVPVAANAAATVADIGVEVDGCLNVLGCLYPAFFSANLWLRPLYVAVFVDIRHRKVHERKLEWKRAKVRGNRVDNRRYSESKKSFMFIGLSIQLASIRNRLETSNVVLLNTRHVFLD